MRGSLLGNLALGVFLVSVGCVLVFAGFEVAAYEKTIADREVTVEGEVVESEVYQRPDGNWTWEVTYEYYFDQKAEIRAQDLQEVYPEEMAEGQTYRTVETGGNSDTEGEARVAMEDEFGPDGNVTVYVDPFFPDEGALSATGSLAPRLLQYGGALLIAIGLLVKGRLARRITT